MNYVEIVLSRSTLKFPVFGWIVQLVLMRNYSHSSIHYTDPRTGQQMVSETSKGEGHEVLFSRWLEYNAISASWEIKLTDEQFTNFLAISNNFKQVPYSRFLGLIGVFCYIITKGKFHPFKDGTKTLFCSESDVYKMREMGIYFLKDADFVTPRDIEKKLDWMAELDPLRVRKCYING